MNDCPNAGMRDQLCDVVHRTLSDADCRRVEAHIATCADCTAEIALLREAHAVLTRRAPVVNRAAIVAALPRPRAARPAPFAAAAWRIEASIAVIAAGAASLSLVRNDVDEVSTVATAAATAPTLSLNGRLSMLEDEELEQLIAELDDFDGTTPTEPTAVLPVPAWEGGTP